MPTAVARPVLPPTPPSDADDKVADKAKTKTSVTVEQAEHLEETTLYTVDDLVRDRAALYGNTPIVSYPSSGIAYVDYSVRQLDVFAYRVAKSYQDVLPARASSTPRVIGMLGPSNLEYMVTMLALMKLGHTILFLSTRIAPEAVASLAETTGCTGILYDARHKSTVDKAVQVLGRDLVKTEILGRDVFEHDISGAPEDTRLTSFDPLETHNHVYIIHSSGSTGFPKPIYQTHKAALVNYGSSMEMRAFATLPLYHNHGICNLFRAIFCGRSIHIYNAELPLTTGHLEAILGAHSFEIFYGVPYALKLLAESPSGIRLLQQLKVVMYGGSACPDDIGNLLTENGVYLVGHYGATEVGQLMTSAREADDNAWNYVRETPKLSPFLEWLPRGPNLFECCVRDGWPAKLTANRDDGSYATKDLFEPHPTLERAWKYVARLDDTVALVNGEKFSPVALEGRIRSDPWVTEAVVFGAGRPYVGALVIASKLTEGMSPAEVVDHIWPIIEAGNRQSEAYGRLARDMIVLLPAGTPYPATDKGSIIRQAFYRQFAKEIDQAYEAAEAATDAVKVMTLDELRSFLQTHVQSILSTPSISADSDFFNLGMDSLQAIRLRQEIVRHVDVGSQKLGSNVVFDYPSVTRLASFLHGLSSGSGPADESTIEEEMEKLIERFSILPDVEPSSSSSSQTTPAPSSSIVVTGTTGSLGAHVASRLAQNPDISTVYCLVRASSPQHARRRVLASMAERRVLHYLTAEERSKLKCLPFDQSDARLGLANYDELASSRLVGILHCAWSVNFNLHLSSFENDCLAGVQNLLSLCQRAGPAAVFSFCSSVSSVARCPDTHIPESLPPLSWAQSMGYAQSKSVAEHVCGGVSQKYGVPTRILRVGQIVADTRFGVWNTTEAIPLMLQSALTIGALPRLPETPSWLPVDIVAEAVVDATLADTTEKSVVVNVTNPRSFDWTADLLPALHVAGLAFDELSPKEWVQRLRDSNPDPVANPPVKLVDFFASKYDRDDADFTPSKTYATDTACRLSPALAAAPVLDQQVVDRFIAEFRRKWEPAAATTKKVVIVCGPCGCGKTTVGEALAARLNASFIEGDAIHTPEARAQMGAGKALTDDDRWAWLGRIREAVIQKAADSDVVVTCSALRRSYRDALCRLTESGLSVVFIDLQAPLQVLHDRVALRTGHYMTEQMVAGQVGIYEPVQVDEDDVVPVDADQSLEDIQEDIKALVV